MRAILILGAVGAVVYLGLTLPDTTISMMIGWGMGWVVLTVIVVPLLMVIMSLLKVLSNANNTTIYNINYNDNSTTTNNTTAYIGADAGNHLADNRPKLTA